MVKKNRQKVSQGKMLECRFQFTWGLILLFFILLLNQLFCSFAKIDTSLCVLSGIKFASNAGQLFLFYGFQALIYAISHETNMQISVEILWFSFILTLSSPICSHLWNFKEICSVTLHYSKPFFLLKKM